MPSSSGRLGALVYNPTFANLAAIAILVWGITTAVDLPRETFPETAVDYVLINAVYPGANPDDVEEGVCVKIEEAIQGIPGIWEIVSLSEQNAGLVMAAVNQRVAPTAEVLLQVRDRVNAITTFPPEMEIPVASEVIIRNRVINIGVSGNLPERTIKQVAEDLRRELMGRFGISQISISGVRDHEISIKLTEESLTRYGLSIQQVMDAVARGSLNLPAGTVRTKYEEITVRTVGLRRSARDFEDLVVIANPDGTSVRLRQVAEVRDAFEETPAFGRINGEPGAVLTVSKTGAEDLSGIAKQVRTFVKAKAQALPSGIKLSTWADASQDVDKRIAMLVRNGITGMILVLVCLLLFMDVPFAFAVALGIPVSFAGALITLGFTGATLNMISLLGLLMATGLIVDDAIVISDSVWSFRRQGLAPDLAAIKGTRHVASPVLMASATTIATFVPLMYVEGVMGKLVYVLPVAVIASIVASAFEAFIILPAHLCEWPGFLKASARPSWISRIRMGVDRRIDRFIKGLFTSTLRRCLQWRAVVLGGTTAVFLVCLGLVLGGRTAFVLFPAVDSNIIHARVKFPDGTPIRVSQAAVDTMEAAARALNDMPDLKPAAPGKLVQHIYSDVGEWPDYVPKRASSLCETSIELMPAEERRVDVAKVIRAWRQEAGAVPGAVSVIFTREQLGPTEGAIEIRLLGDDLDELRQAADEVVHELKTYDYVFNIQDDLTPGKRELQVSFKPSARNLGLTVSELAAQMRQGLYGGEALRLQRGADEIRVMVSYADADRRSLAAIENLRIRTRNGAEIPFTEVADTRLVRRFSTITRQAGTRLCRIKADIDERFANAEQIVSDMDAAFLPELDRRYPGVRYVLDGQRKRIDESLQSLVRGACVAVVVIFALLGTVLRSYLQPLIILVAVPLGAIGAILGHIMLGYDLTLMSAFGMVALSGIVVNDALVLIDQINRNVAEGMHITESVVSACQTRFRAVVLTTITTVFGLMPLIAERSSQAQPLIPLAITIAFGELFGTVLTLIVIPAMFVLVNDVKRVVRWLRLGGDFPAPEAVEALAGTATMATTSHDAKGVVEGLA